MSTRATFWSPRLLLVFVVSIVALALGAVLGMLDTTRAVAVVGILVAGELGAALIVLRQDAFIAVGIVGISVLIDWYQLFGWPFGAPVVATVVALGFAGLLFFARSPAHSWVAPPYLWLWGLLLGLAAVQVLRGVKLQDSALYYVWMILTPLLLYIIGTQVARDVARARRLFSALSGLGALIAAHTIIEAQTGVFLLATQRQQNYLLSAQGFLLQAGSQVSRAGSFLQNPDFNGVFLALLVFIPVGLFMESSSRPAKIIYAGETVLLLTALLFTYSAGSWVAVGGGLIALMLLVGQGRYRFWLLALIGAAGAVLFFAFPSALALLIQHGTAPQELQMRQWEWQTVIRVISAYPLTGTGLGYQSYLQRASPYRVFALPDARLLPHDSYLELAAMAGLPVLLIFLATLACTMQRALRNWSRVNRRYRPLLGAAIAAVVVLMINSFTIPGWTLAPVTATAWLIIGAVSSPLLGQTPDPHAPVDGHPSATAAEAGKAVLVGSAQV